MKLQTLTVLQLLAFAVSRSTFKEEKVSLLTKNSPTETYVVVLKNDLLDNEVAEHVTLVRSMINGTGEILNEYNIGTSKEKKFRGYRAKLNKKQMDMIRSLRQVKYVEGNQEYDYHTLQADCVNDLVEPWGLVRTTLVDWPPAQYDYSYAEDASGEGVDAYIIDTGIDLTHPEFEERAKFGTDTVDNPPRDDDPNGHGTHIAGIVMSKSYGFARKATAISVRVLNAEGCGSPGGVIAGINWAVNDHQNAGPTKKSVAVLSFGGGFNQAMNEAINAAIDDGVHFFVPAGNSNNDACTISPASSEAITVAACDINDQKASFSSYGSCVDVIAPGVAVLSTTPNGGVAEYSGTSYAAANVAGVAAKYLSTQPADIKQDSLLTWIQETGTKDKIVGFPTNPPTPNLLPFMECR